jgi:hypothetical protein
MEASLPFSRKIKDIEYDPEKNTLSIAFGAGIKKVYCDVPVAVYKELTESDDPNRIYNNKINGLYRVL